MTDPAFQTILRGLAAADVRFVLIGGLALGSWGVIRGTKDIDIVIDREPANIRALAELAVELDGQVQSKDGFFSSAFSIAAALSTGERVLIGTPSGPLDVVGGFPGVPDYGDLRPRAKLASIAGVEVAVCSREDLRKMKKAAGRTRDLADLEDLAALDDD